ncbi:MAG: M66 family metalloprotease [Myxococcota bacterium]
MRWAWIMAALLVACGGTEPVPTVGDYAAGVGIRRVAIMQGVDNTLYRWNGPSPRDVPVIARRDGLLRFYVSLAEDFEARDLVGTLTLVDNLGQTLETLIVEQRVQRASLTADLDSTFNFKLTGDQIRQGTEFFFELRETDVTRPGGRAEDTTFNSAVEGNGFNPRPTDTLTLVIIPLIYEADGSNRVPDISDEHVEEMRLAMYALYPASDVVIRVEEPRSWSEPVSSTSGQEWTNLLIAVSNLAAGAQEAPNTYYYGLFDPASSIGVYCQRGCTLGLSTLATTAEAFPRASIGLGYRGIAASTLVHEVGHAHGRPHAPCGGARGTDPDYPYDDAAIGVWGYSINNDELREPSRVDMMSYCDPIWISDYNFALLHDRIDELRDFPRSVPVEVTRLFVDENGTTTVGTPVKVRGPHVNAQQVEVDVYDASGEWLRSVKGAYSPFSHFDGGSVLLDEVLKSGHTAQVRGVTGEGGP